MNDFSIPMALVDFIPVLLFAWAAVLLMNDLFNKMRKTSFVLFAAGSINIFAAGFLKALWKLLYAAGVCDFALLNTLFFPMQSLGFLMAGAGMILMFTRKRSVLLATAPPVFSGTFLFVGLMVAGLGCMDGGLCVLALKMKKRLAAVIFVAAFLCALCMGYLSSQDFTQSFMNWLAQIINTIGQGLLLTGVVLLHKSGLKELQLH